MFDGINMDNRGKPWILKQKDSINLNLASIIIIILVNAMKLSQFVLQLTRFKPLLMQHRCRPYARSLNRKR